MGYPIFEPNKIPVDINKEKVVLESINVDGKEIEFSSVLVGVPHTVIFVDDMNFIEVVDRKNINIYTWERGAGRTLGCGTGSCASVVIGNVLSKLDDSVHVKTEGGNLEVQLKENYEIFMKGSATTICNGEFLNI